MCYPRRPLFENERTEFEEAFQKVMPPGRRKRHLWRFIVLVFVLIDLLRRRLRLLLLLPLLLAAWLCRAGLLPVLLRLPVQACGNGT